MRQDQTGVARPRLAVLCTVFNEQQTIPLFLERIAALFARISDRCAPMLCFVDNGSTDGSLELIREAHNRYGDVYVIVLSRNFGYQCALETALKAVTADLYVMIDVDCEDPPEMIEQFLDWHNKGYEIVYGERVDRPEGVVMKSLRNLFYRLVRGVADENFVLNMAEFSLITAEVRHAIIQDSNSFPFLRASIGRIGFRRKNLPYRRHARIAGETHYNLLGMTFFAVAGILTASTLALRLPAYAFPFWFAAMAGIATWAALSPGSWQMPLMSLLGFLYLGFSVMASSLYVARIYKNGLSRPNSIIRRHLSLLPESARVDSYEQSPAN